MYSKCQKCGRRLTDPESMIRGYGPECWEEIVDAVREAMEHRDSEPIPGQMTLEDFIAGRDEDNPAGAGN